MSVLPAECGQGDRLMQLIEEFQFKNYFKRGSTYYFKKKDLQDLNLELKERNINLKVYEELLRDNEKFQKYIVSVSQSEGIKKRRRLRKVINPYYIEELNYPFPNRNSDKTIIITISKETDHRCIGVCNG